MLKALLRKQLLEIRYIYVGGRKGADGKRKTARNPKGILILLAVLYLMMMFAFYGLSVLLGSSIFPLQMDWLYFTVMSILAFIVGIFGSVLSTAGALFRSKDNELLLSMPIPPSKIIFVRMITVYLMGFIYEAFIMIPAVVYYFAAGNVTVTGAVFSILGIFILGFLIAAFSCAAGWIVALVAAKLKNQKIVSVLLIILVIAAFYVLRFRIEAIFGSIAANAESIAQGLQGWGYILYAPGLGMSGNVAAFLAFAGVTAVLFGLAYYAVTRSFSKIALMQESEKQKAFHTTDIRAGSVADALLKRELKRFLASVTYMLNAGFGILLLVAGAVFTFIEIPQLRMIMDQGAAAIPGFERMLPVLCACIVCALTSFCVMAACSISMEGKQIWIYQAAPLDPYQIFRAKIYLHVLLTGIPAVLCVLALGIAFQMGIASFICMVVFTMMYIVLCAFLELRLDLKRPKLNWTNENQALKTNMTVVLDMLASMFAPLLIAGLYMVLNLVLGIYIGAELFLVIFIAVFAALILLANRWFLNKGRRLFAQL